MVINYFNNTDAELLAILLGWHKKYTKNNIRCIQDRHFGCISLPIFSISFVFRYVFINGKVFIVFIYSWWIIKTWQSLFIYVWTRFYKWICLPTKRVKEKMGFYEFLSRTEVITKENILGIIIKYLECNSMLTCLEITTKKPHFSVLRDEKSDSYTL